MDRFLIVLFAFMGGLLSYFSIWLTTKPRSSFDLYDFGAAIVRSVIAAMIYAVGYSFLSVSGLTAMDILTAILAGAGVNGTLQAIGNGSGNASFPLKKRSSGKPKS